MDVISQIVPLIQLVVGVLGILALIEIFYIGATLKQILAAINKADKRRREEFDAMTQD